METARLLFAPIMGGRVPPKPPLSAHRGPGTPYNGGETPPNPPSSLWDAERAFFLPPRLASLALDDQWSWPKGSKGQSCMNVQGTISSKSFLLCWSSKITFTIQVKSEIKQPTCDRPPFHYFQEALQHACNVQHTCCSSAEALPPPRWS